MVRKWRETGSASDAGGAGLGGWEVAGAARVEEGALGSRDTAAPADRSRGSSFCSKCGGRRGGEGGTDRGGSTDVYTAVCEGEQTASARLPHATGNGGSRGRGCGCVWLLRAAGWPKPPRHCKTITLPFREI